MNLALRDYQSSVLTATQQSFRTGHRRPLITLPCGAGKTVCFASMARSAQSRGKTVWFLVHRRELLDQTNETFDRFDIPLQSIYIGMVGTVANNIARFPKPDFIIFDEGHHASAATWRKISEAFPDAFITGLTATPCRLDGKPLGEVYDDLIIGATTRELIDSGYLAPYRYFAPAVADLSALKRRGSDYDATQAAQLLSERAVFGDVIRHYRDYADGLQAICYCSTVKHSERTAEEFRATGISAAHLDGETPTIERKRTIQAYRDKQIQVLCSCDLISEGLDISGCSCCMLLRPTQSLGLFIQQSMRCMRPEPNKTAVILDFVNNYSRHGLPSDDREWSLTETVKAHSQYREDGMLYVRQCSVCYGTFKTGPSVCPYCGAVVTRTREEIKNIKEIKLSEIKQHRRDNAVESVKEKGSIHDCKNVFEIMAWCKANGRKPGYGYHIAKARGLLRAK
jgi:superfamily II DNA or RNA helicase